MHTTSLVRTLAFAAVAIAAPLTMEAQEVKKGAAAIRALAAARATNELRSSGSNSVRPITVGARQSSALDATDPTLDDGSHFEVWALELRAGQAVTITMRSGQFDAVLMAVNGANDQERYENDDFETTSTDARLTFRATTATAYAIIANSLGGGERGNYTIEVAAVGGSGGGNSGGGMAGDMMGAASGNTITIGQTIQGELSSSDPTLTDASHFDEYVFNGNAGDRIVITLRSGTFDAYLKVLNAAGEEIANNDDAFEGNTDAQVVIALPSSGRFSILANSLGAGETGSYTIAVERAR